MREEDKKKRRKIGSIGRYAGKAGGRSIFIVLTKGREPILRKVAFQRTEVFLLENLTFDIFIDQFLTDS
jgi:hypothetical protein